RRNSITSKYRFSILSNLAVGPHGQGAGADAEPVHRSQPACRTTAEGSESQPPGDALIAVNTLGSPGSVCKRRSGRFYFEMQNLSLPHAVTGFAQADRQFHFHLAGAAIAHRIIHLI